MSPEYKVDEKVNEVVMDCPDKEQMLNTKLDDVPTTCVGVPSQAV